jgi:ubiquinone/menaquinone biosynthesis C-methylase UbiE
MILEKIRKIARKILGRDKIKSIGKEYWEKAASGSEAKAMNRICDGFDKKDFETKKQSLIFMKEFQVSSQDEILELACGMGRTCRWIAPKVKQYTGVDFIPQMIERAKSYNSSFSNAKFVLNDGRTLKIFNDNTFDFVYCELAFQHMTKDVQQSYTDEVYRVLKKGGTFFVDLPKIEFYKDPTFALSKEEANNLLQKYKITHISDSPAYYVIMAKKLSSA